MGYPEDEFGRIIDKLVEQLQNSNAAVRANTTRTLGDLGCAKKEVLIGLIHLLQDKEVRPQHMYDVIILT